MRYSERISEERNPSAFFREQSPRSCQIVSLIKSRTTTARIRQDAAIVSRAAFLMRVMVCP